MCQCTLPVKWHVKLFGKWLKRVILHCSELITHVCL